MILMLINVWLPPLKCFQWFLFTIRIKYKYLSPDNKALFANSSPIYSLFSCYKGLFFSALDALNAQLFPLNRSVHWLLLLWKILRFCMVGFFSSSCLKSKITFSERLFLLTLFKSVHFMLYPSSLLLFFIPFFPILE